MATNKHVVTGDQYRTIDKRMGEVKRQLCQEGGSPLDPECVAWMLQQIVDGKRLVLADEASVALPAPATILTVPDLSSPELVALVERRFTDVGTPLTYRNEAYLTWNFYQYRVAEGQPPRTINVRGKRYEVATWAPKKYVTTDEVRRHFKDLGRSRPLPASPSGGNQTVYRGGSDKASQEFVPFDGNTGAFLVWIMDNMPEGYYVSIPSEDDLLWRSPESDGLCAPFFCRAGGHRELRLSRVAVGWDGNWVFVAFRELPSE